MWEFVAKRKELGEKLISSPNTYEKYIIKSSGTWIPQEDLDYVLSIREYCPACGRFPVRAYHKALPSERQMADMPTRKPRKRYIVTRVIEEGEDDEVQED